MYFFKQGIIIVSFNGKIIVHETKMQKKEWLWQTLPKDFFPTKLDENIWTYMYLYLLISTLKGCNGA